MIFVGQSKPRNWEAINRDFDDLKELVDSADATLILEKLQTLVPDFGSRSGKPADVLLRLDHDHDTRNRQYNGTPVPAALNVTA